MALTEWDKANLSAVYNPEWFRREILPRLGSVKLSEVAEAAGCSRRPRPTGLRRDFPCGGDARACDLGELWIKS
ncbi:MAG: hypothetical protein ACLP1E_11185 [Acidimicrobiales bacterium]